jgi:hypothetical protein
MFRDIFNLHEQVILPNSDKDKCIENQSCNGSLGEGNNLIGTDARRIIWTSDNHYASLLKIQHFVPNPVLPLGLVIDYLA